MSEVFVKPLDSESQKIIQLLIDKLIILYKSNIYNDEIDLLVNACKDIDVKLCKYFREDICSVFNFSCQIIFNYNICLVHGTGSTEDEAYRNATEKFINYCFNQRNQSPPIFIGNGINFVEEVLENCVNIDIIDSFITICRNYESRNKHIDYQNLKNQLKNNNNNFILSETFRQSEKCVVCSIFLNETLLIQQGKGNNEKDALINTFNDMLEAYDLKTHDNTSNSVAQVVQDKNIIIENLAEKFKMNRTNSANYWVTIEKCVKELGFQMDVQFHLNTCTVKINGVEIVNVLNDNDYCGYIVACKKLIRLMDKGNKVTSLSKTNFENRRKPNLSGKNRDERIKTIIKAINAKQNESCDPVWPIVNDAFMEENMKLELHYVETKKLKFLCSFDCLGLQICCAEGDDKPKSREAAAKDLLQNPSYSN